MAALKAIRSKHFRLLLLGALVGIVGLIVWGAVLFRGGARPASTPTAEPDLAALQAAVRAAPDRPEARLRLIAHLLAARRSYDALDAAREARASLPDDPRVALALAEALHATARTPEAIALLRPLAVSRPEARLPLAAYLVQSGQREEALRLLRGLASPTAEEALQAGQVYLDALEPTAALAVLKPAAQAHPAHADLEAAYGLALLLAGRYGEAATVLDHAALRQPHTAALQFSAGCALRLSGDLARLEEADARLAQAAALAPQEGLFHYELGLARVQLRDWAKARESLEQAVRLLPDTPEVHRDLSRLYRHEKEPVRAALAEAKYRRTLEIAREGAPELERLYAAHPEEKELGFALTGAYLDAGRIPDAVALLERMQQRAPADPDVLWELFFTEKEQAHYDRALHWLEALLAADRQDTRALVEKAGILQLLTRYKEAEEILLGLRDREPEKAVRHYQAGLALALYSERPDRDRLAEECLRKAVELQPDRAEGQYTLAMVLHRTGRAREAIPYLRRALDILPRYPDALRLLGRANLETGDRARSEDTFQLLRRVQAENDEKARLELPVKQRQNLPASRFTLARYHLGRGELVPAARHFEIAAHARTGDWETHRLLERLYGHARRFQRQYEERETLVDRAGKPDAAR